MQRILERGPGHQPEPGGVIEHVGPGSRLLTLTSPGSKTLQTPSPNSPCFFKTWNKKVFG